MAMLRSLPNLAMKTPLIRDVRTQMGTPPVLGNEDSQTTSGQANRRPYHLLIAGGLQGPFWVPAGSG